MKKINQETSEMISSLAKVIANAIRYSDDGFDRTFISVVKKRNENKTYEILDEYGNVHTCVLAIPNITLSEGQRVFVTIPCGNISKMYISGIHPQISKR